MMYSQSIKTRFCQKYVYGNFKKNVYGNKKCFDSLLFCTCWEPIFEVTKDANGV